MNVCKDCQRPKGVSSLCRWNSHWSVFLDKRSFSRGKKCFCVFLSPTHSTCRWSDSSFLVLDWKEDGGTLVWSLRSKRGLVVPYLCNVSLPPLTHNFLFRRVVLTFKRSNLTFEFDEERTVGKTYFPLNDDRSRLSENIGNVYLNSVVPSST